MVAFARGCELDATVDILKDRISDHRELLVVVDMTAYLMAFHPTPVFATIRRRCVDVTRSWISIREEQIAEVHDLADVPGLRADQATYAMYGVLAHGGTDSLHSSDLDSLCQCIIAANNGYVYETDSSDKQMFRALRERCQRLM